MKKDAFQLWKTTICLAWAVLSPIGLSASSPSVPERPAEETAPLEEQEIPVTKKNTYPYVEIHGDYRWLWGRGQFRADSRPMPDKVRRHDLSSVPMFSPTPQICFFASIKSSLLYSIVTLHNF